MSNRAHIANTLVPAGRYYNPHGIPHFEAEGVSQAVTIRLHDSIPPGLLDAWREQVRHLAPDVLGETLRRRVEAFLDRDGSAPGHLLSRAGVASVVCESIRHFDGVRYDLHAWVVMPNHAHVHFTPRPGFRMSDIVRTWKSFSGREANRLLGREGSFWQGDYFDRFIRSEEHFARVVAYVERNPVKAGLCAEPGDWPWSSAAGRGTASVH